MVCKPPRWAWLDNGIMWGEHSSDRCHVANADPFPISDPFPIADRYDLANGDGNVCRQRGVLFCLLECYRYLRESAWTTPDDDSVRHASVTTRHARCSTWYGYPGWQCGIYPLHSRSDASGDYGVYGFRPACRWLDEK
jgi:hypothetical protein